MIGYHWSPTSRRSLITKHGLLVPTKHPRLMAPTTCSEGHRNPHISLGRTPFDAWNLSGGYLLHVAKRDKDPDVVPLNWDLWQVGLGRAYKAYGMELQSTQDIPFSRMRFVGNRTVVI